MSNELVKKENLSEDLKRAQELLNSGLLPKNVNTPQKVLILMQKGKEMGLKPLEAVQSIYIVDNKPALASQLMLSLLYKSGVLADIKIVDEKDKCMVTMTRKNMSPYTTSFSLEDAKRANLLYKDNWKKYPDKMLRSRAISACARVVAPDVIAGLYTIDEVEGQGDIEQDIAAIEQTMDISTPEKYESGSFLKYSSQYVLRYVFCSAD